MPDASPHKLSFDEFKLYYESTEKVTDRRIDTNRWNYSVCVAILVAIALVVKWSLSTVTSLWVGFAAVSIICIMAILFCLLWIRQIHDFKNLNTAKFEVLNEMAPALDFSSEKPEMFASYCPFEKEWKKLTHLKALEQTTNSRVFALKSTRIEYFIPQAFVGLFIGIPLVLSITMAINWPPAKLVQRLHEPAASLSEGRTR